MRKTENWTVTQSEESITLMTPYRPPSSQKQILHIRSGWQLTLSSLWRLFLRLSFWTEVKMLYEKDGKLDSDTEWRIYYSDDTLPTSLIAETDPSHSFRMTTDAFLIIAPYRPRSFWMDARMLFEKDGKRNSNTEWRIYYADDVLPLTANS